MTLRALLNRLRWDPGAEPGGVTLELRVREHGREMTYVLRFADVREILPTGVVSLDGTFLPYHRVVVVRRGQEVLWQAPERGGDGQT